MKTIVVKQKELLEIIKRINLIKVKFGQNDIWMIAPVLYTSDDSIDIIADFEKAGHVLTLNEKVTIKFQKQGYEYLVNGEVIDIIKGFITAATIKFSKVMKLENQRRELRFDTNLNVILSENHEKTYEGILKNISKGGALLVTEADFETGSLVDFNVDFKAGSFKAVSKVLRKSVIDENNFSYGIQFVEISENYEKTIAQEMADYEKEYLKSLTLIREFEKKSGTVYREKIAIFSNDNDVRCEVCEGLVKVGAENFEVFHDFKFYIDFFIEEKPGLVILDSNTLDEGIYQLLSKILDLKEYFITKIILIVPLKYSKRKKELKPFLQNTAVLFKPLIYNEFEEEVVKFL